MDVSPTEQTFIFRDEDFGSETEDFDAAAFVSKFHRVIPLESLREQLVTYSNYIRKQLYVIINRDYKDFITIATKLDGLDTRLQVIQRPLLDLRVDLSTLHNGLASSLQAIQNKLTQRKQIAEKRKCVETLLHCMDALQSAQAAIQSIDNSNRSSNNESLSSSRHLLFRSYDRLKAQHHSLHSPDQHSQLIQQEEVFLCTEYENAAYNLVQIYSTLQPLSGLLTSVESYNKMYKLVCEQVDKTKAQLVEKLARHIEHRFSLASTSNIDKSTSIIAVDKILEEHRGMAHCLRALECVDKLSVAQDLLASNVMQPLVKSLLSVGKVDGKEGKGSYSGLDESLQSICTHIKSYSLYHILLLIQHMQYSDVVVYGVVQPVFKYIQNKFPNLFSLSLPNIFAANYLALNDFISNVEHTLSLQGLAQHKIVREFMKGFKYEVYIQLRNKEIISRCDHVCYYHLKHANSEGNKVYQTVYVDKSSIPNKPSIGNIVLSMPVGEIQKLHSSLTLNLYHEFYRLCLLEILICLHPSIALRDIYAKYLHLTQRLLVRFTVHVAMYLNLFVEGLGNWSNRADFDQTRGQYLLEYGGSAASISLTESLFHLHDGYQVLTYLQSYFPTTRSSQPLSVSLPGLQALEKLLQVQWKIWTENLIAEARKTLQAVKGIAGKYRMTNKPAPSAASPYVEQTFTTLRQLLSEHREEIYRLCEHFASESGKSALNAWSGDIAIAVINTFEEQVNSLFETVKVMDNALQRRAKIMSNSSSGAAQSNEALRDSDKIALQVQLDVQAFGEEMRKVDKELVDIVQVKERYGQWKKQVDEMVQQQLQNK